jgi:hypothetical protein
MTNYTSIPPRGMGAQLHIPENLNHQQRSKLLNTAVSRKSGVKADFQATQLSCIRLEKLKKRIDDNR